MTIEDRIKKALEIIQEIHGDSAADACLQLQVALMEMELLDELEKRSMHENKALA